MVRKNNMDTITARFEQFRDELVELIKQDIMDQVQAKLGEPVEKKRRAKKKPGRPTPRKKTGKKPGRPPTIKKAFKDARARTGMSVNDIAAVVGVHRGTLNHLVAGSRTTTKENARAIVKMLQRLKKPR